tara:strand:- start:1653 stop:2747 length:1095 start_codon:yes stop_codon:yes gene_type:complete
VNGIYFVCSGRDFHAVDWYRQVKKILPERNIKILTDLVEGEGFEKILINSDNVEILFPLDKLLSSKYSTYGNIWRNFVKLLISVVCVYKLKKIYKKNINFYFHAHSMYYIFLCYIAGIRYIATPMGSDVLVRPTKSILYKYFVKKSLIAADTITVDSLALQNKVLEITNKKSIIVQNGIDTRKIKKKINKKIKRDIFLSIRAWEDNYRIDNIISSRNISKSKVNLSFIYPFSTENYKNKLKYLIEKNDNIIGSLDKNKMYSLLNKTILTFSIPVSDSSPRSVYEAIFCGSCVAVTYSKYIDALPKSMKTRVYVIDLKNLKWFDEAVKFGNERSKIPFYPCKIALDTYDDFLSISKVTKTLYGKS